MNYGDGQLILTNQFGEESFNEVQGLLLVGAGAPVNGASGTGNGVSTKGGLYIDKTNALVYQNTNTKASPTWVQIGTANTNALLTGFVSGAGTVADTDTILQAFNKLVGNTQNKTVLANLLTGFTAGVGIVASTDTVLEAMQKVAPATNGTLAATGANLETLTGAGAISTTKLETALSNSTGGDFAATLAAPSNQDGQIKILKMTVRTSNNFTLALTNVSMSGGYTPTGTTTMTFSAVGHSAVLMAVGAKWVYLGGSAIVS